MTGASLPRGARSVMQSRHAAPPDELDFFPTPPWATRAFLDRLRADVPPSASALEPAAGEGHMAWVLAEWFAEVRACDVFAHDWLAPTRAALTHEGVRDFLASDHEAESVDWVITNPPFKTAIAFAREALRVARVGVALLVRTSWLEGAERHDLLFVPHPPTVVLQYAERVPMARGRWDPKGSTATSYCWVVWFRGWVGPTGFGWIAPGSRARFSRPEDRVFAAAGPAPLLELEGGA